MPITFGQEALFASGPATIHVGGLSLRHARERPLSARGERVFSQGVTGRSITQIGTLLDDTPDGLEGQRESIERKLDGIPRKLTDDLDRTWPDVVMTAFEPEQISRIGARWRMRYRIEYVQAAS